MRRRSVEGRVVAVTGGARGIGAAIAAELTGRGARVAIGDVDEPLALRTAAGIGASAHPLNVADPESWRAFVAVVEATHGPVDVLVSNAGIMPIGAFLSESEDSLRRQLDVNLAGVLLGVRAVLPGMLERGRGHLVNIASQAGKAGFAGGVTYCATKYGVVGLSHGLDDELRDTPVKVTCVLPGVVNTDLSLGLPETRLAPKVEPAEIAAAVAAALERPRREVWVPRSGRASMTIVRLLPARTRALIRRALRVPDPLLHADRGARAGYESRVGDDQRDAAPEREIARS